MLTINQPTPNTTLYTISTKLPAKTPFSHLHNAALLLLRIIALALAIAISWTEYERTVDISKRPLSQLLAYWLGSIPLSQHISAQLDSTLIWRSVVCLVSIWFVFQRTHVEESLLVIRGLGVQTSTTSKSYLWSNTTSFIPTTAVQDIFIHEAFIGFKVKYYLSIVVEGEPQVVVVFSSTLPRLEHLRAVWRGARACLYESKT